VKISAISVIIPVRNEGARLRTTVLSIVRGRSCHFPLELVIVDDDSDDGACDSLAEIVAGIPEVYLVVRRLPAWSGIPFSRNRGAEAATFPIYVITDANTKFPLNWDLPIWRSFHPARMLSATILDMASPFRGYGCQLLLPSMGVTWIPVPFAYGVHVPVAPCTGSVIDRALFHQLGGYDESLPVYGAAEPEFSVRLWLSGNEIVIVPELEIQHRFRPKAEHDAYRTSIRGALLANYLRFACYYLPWELLEQTYAYYSHSSPKDFQPCMDGIVAHGVWKRRADLANLPLDFGWFLRRFGHASVAREAAS
jgi:glycosyltransferase involved in cell wall biosynthesis